MTRGSIAADSKATVLGPSDVPSESPQALILLLPGGLLGPSDYAGLGKAVQDQAGPEVAVWFAVASLDWQKVAAVGPDSGDPTPLVEAAIKEALEEAASQGFKAQALPSGRVENLFVAMHSYSAAWATGYPMKNAAGVIILGSGIVPQPGVWPSVYEFPRSILHVFGQVDGQWRLPKAVLIAAEGVAAAVQLGPRYMAQTRPVCVVPGMNHAHISNGVVNSARGDLPTVTPQDACLEAVAGHMVQFVAANHPDSPPGVVSQALDSLLHATREAVALLSPFAQALGRGCLQSLFDLNPEDLGASLGVSAPSLLATGAEVLPFTFANKAYVAHPGELAAAEKLCRLAQLRMLERGLPESVTDSVQVVATVHTSLETFIYSQPTVFQMDTPAGKRTIVHAHCYLQRESLGASPEAYRKPLSPQYYMKLRKAEVAAHAMGLVIEDFVERNVQGCELNQELYEQALREAHPLVLKTFEARGQRLTFPPDRDVTAEVKTPVDWMALPQALQHDPATNTTSLTSPFVTTPTQKLPAYDRGPGRFAGNHYIKCCSLAWMHEWLMIEGLRQPGTW